SHPIPGPDLLLVDAILRRIHVVVQARTSPRTDDGLTAGQTNQPNQQGLAHLLWPLVRGERVEAIASDSIVIDYTPPTSPRAPLPTILPEERRHHRTIRTKSAGGCFFIFSRSPPTWT